MKGRKRKSEQNALSREISIIILYYRRLARSKSLLGWYGWWFGGGLVGVITSYHV
jgi:hypothetical protein